MVTPISHFHRGFYSSDHSNKPYAFDPIDDRSGSSVEGLNDSFKFECLDEAFEVKHRITVAIREWNAFDHWETYGTQRGFMSSQQPNAPSGTVTITPDSTGEEAVPGSAPRPVGNACGYGNFGSPGLPFNLITRCNDIQDWDDFLEDPNYANTTDANNDGTPEHVRSRGSWFPSEEAL